MISIRYHRLPFSGFLGRDHGSVLHEGLGLIEMTAGSLRGVNVPAYIVRSQRIK